MKLITIYVQWSKMTKILSQFQTIGEIKKYTFKIATVINFHWQVLLGEKCLDYDIGVKRYLTFIPIFGSSR